MIETAKQENNVVNIDTPSWAPSQVARWLQEEVDAGRVKAVSVLIERPDDPDSTKTEFDHQWSENNREGLLYMVTWLYRFTITRYFG